MGKKSSRYIAKNKLRLITAFQIIACWLILSCSSFAQGDATLRVLVSSEETGAAIAGANIVLLNSETQEIEHSGVSNNYGLYEFTSVSAQDFILKVSFIGFGTYQEPISLSSGEIIVERVSLGVNIEDLGGLVVEGEREIVTGEAGIEKISQADINRVPTAGASGDLASYLGTLPGVISTGDRGGELYIRGGEPSQNRSYIDGIPVTKPYHISNLYSAFPEQVVQNVDLYAGGFPARFMDATSAIIDVNIRPGNFKETQWNSSASPYLAAVQVEGPVKQGTESFLVSARKSLIKTTSPAIYNEDRDLNFYDLLARYTKQSDSFTCSATGMLTYDSGGVSGLANIGVSWRNIMLGGRCLGYANNFKYPIEVTGGYSHYTNSEKSTGTNVLTSAMGQYFFKINLQEQWFGVPVDYGFKLNFRSFETTLDQRFLLEESFSDKQAVVNTYVASVIDVNDKLTLEPSFGIMGTLTSTPTLEPRLRASYLPAPQSEISLATGIYYQSMTGFGDVRDPGSTFKVWQPIDEDLPIPRATHAILGFKQQMGPHLLVNIEGYGKRFDDISVPKWNIAAGFETETTLAEGRAYGADLQLEYDRDPVYAKIGYGYAKVEYEAKTEDLGAWYDNTIFRFNPSHDQRHKLNAIFSYQLGAFTGNASWGYGSGQPYTQILGYDLVPDVTEPEFYERSGMARILYDRPNGGRLPAFHRLDISIERPFVISDTATLNAKVGAINLYNRNNMFYFNIRTLQRVNQSSLMPYVALQANFN